MPGCVRIAAILSGFRDLVKVLRAPPWPTTTGQQTPIRAVTDRALNCAARPRRKIEDALGKESQRRVSPMSPDSFVTYLPDRSH